MSEAKPNEEAKTTAKAEAKAQAPAESPRVAAPAGWHRSLANAHRARARRAAVAIYKKQQGLDKDTFEEECKVQGEVVGLDPATIITLITIAWKLYQFWKSRKASLVQVEAGLPEGELDIDFDVAEE